MAQNITTNLYRQGFLEGWQSAREAMLTHGEIVGGTTLRRQAGRGAAIVNQPLTVPGATVRKRRKQRRQTT
jgi:hypothetical protein